MSALGWQDLVAGAGVALALAWLVRRWLRRRRRATPFCGDCPGCAPEPGERAPGAESRGAPAGGSRVIPLSEIASRK